MTTAQDATRTRSARVASVTCLIFGKLRGARVRVHSTLAPSELQSGVLQLGQMDAKVATSTCRI